MPAPKSRRCSERGLAPPAGPARDGAGRRDAARAEQFFRADARRASSRPAPRRSASSSGWSPSGPTIFVFRSPRATSAAPPPAPSSARRSAPMCSAVSPTCCARSSSIRRCSIFSTTRSRSAPIRWRATTMRGPQRESGARNPRTAHDGRRLRLHPERRHSARLYPDRLDDRRARRQARRARRLRLQRQRPRARAGDAARPPLSRRTASPRARRRSPILRASRRPRTIIARKFARHFVADVPIRRWSRGWPRSFATPTAISARSPARWSMTRPRGARRRPKSAIPGN